MRKAWAFLKRDFLLATSYKVSFAMELAGVLIWVPIFYFIGQGVNLGDSDKFAKYGGGYFEFLLVGIGFLGYLTISLRTFNQSIRDSQMMGTLEIVLLSPTSITQLLFFSSTWIYFFVTVRFVLFILLGSLFGLELEHVNPLSSLVVLLISIPAFASLGIISATVILLIKRGESLNAMLSFASFVLGGVMFPISVLPAWLQPISKLLPITHSLEAMRLALSQGASLSQLAPQLGVLAIFAFVLLPLALSSFWLAVRWTKASGSLSHY